MIPLTATVRMRLAEGRSWRIWIPLFVVWLMLLPVALVLFPMMFLLGLLVRVSAFRLYGTVWGTLSSLRNTLVEVENEDVLFRVRIV
jgi:hypothetical protein